MLAFGYIEKELSMKPPSGKQLQSWVCGSGVEERGLAVRVSRLYYRWQLKPLIYIITCRKSLPMENSSGTRQWRTFTVKLSKKTWEGKFLSFQRCREIMRKCHRSQNSIISKSYALQPTLQKNIKIFEKGSCTSNAPRTRVKQGLLGVCSI